MKAIRYLVPGLVAGFGAVCLAASCCGTCGAPEKEGKEAKEALKPAGDCGHGGGEKIHAAAGCKDGECAVKADRKAKEHKAEKDAELPAIETGALQTLLRSGVPVALLDARSGRWDDGRRIPGAKALHAGSSTREVAKMLPDKNALIVVYCANPQCPAGAQLAAKLAKLGYGNVVKYYKGIEGWVAAGLPVETASE